MKNLSDIKLDHLTGDVIVLDEKGQEIFRKPKTAQYVSIANSIYMCHKHPHGRAIQP